MRAFPSVSLARGSRYLGWIGPAAVIVLMPKCPFCLAGYVAAFTGLGLSFRVAETLRWTLLVLAGALLLTLAVRALRRKPGRRDGCACACAGECARARVR